MIGIDDPTMGARADPPMLAQRVCGAASLAHDPRLHWMREVSSATASAMELTAHEVPPAAGYRGHGRDRS